MRRLKRVPRAVSLNVTVVPTGAGNVTLFPGDATPPPTSTLNFLAGVNRANNALLQLSADGAGTLAARAFLTGGGQVDLIVDVNGYFQ